MILVCDVCNKENEVECEDLPELACDEEEFECRHCHSILLIGWYVEAECRGVVNEISERAE